MSDEKKYPKLEYISSCTINDAVAKMLGWLQGPVYDENIKFAEDGNVHEEDLPFLRTLPNTIEEQITYLIGVANMELSEAKSKKASPDVIEEKTKILNKRYKEMELAYRYKLDIEHELNKGKSSVLVIDRKITKESGEKHITIRGLHDWAFGKYDISIDPCLNQQEVTNDQQNQSTVQRGGNPPDNDGWPSTTKKENLYTTFAFLVEALAEVAPKYKHVDKPNVSQIAELIAKHAKDANSGEKLQGQSAESIKDRIEESIKIKKSKLPGNPQ